MAQTIKMSEVRKQFPMYNSVDDDKLLEAIRQRYYASIPAEQFGAMVERDVEMRPQLTEEWRRNTMRSMAGAKAKESSWLRRAVENYGAGTAELVTGAQQRWNDMFGDDKSKTGLKRRAADERAVAETLAENTTGGGALQVAGNVAPTLAVPVGAFANTATRAATFLPRAYQALRTGGAIAPAATTAARLGGAGLVGDSLLAGGAYGALRPTVEGESVLQNAAEGAAFSAALPGLVGIGNYGRRMVTQSGGGDRAAERIVGDIAGEGADATARNSVLQRTLSQLRGSTQQGPIGLSSAAQLDSAELARLERGSRARNAANWSEFDERQAREVADEVRRATREAQKLRQRKEARRAGWAEDWARVSGSAQLGEFAGDLAKLRNSLDDAMLGQEASNPTVLKMLKAISDDIDRVTGAGAPYTPGHLQQIRANMAAKFSPFNPNALAGAPRDSAARLSTMQQIDEILNRATGGQYQTVLENYARRSRLIDASKAAGRVRETFYGPSDRVLGVAADAAGQVPKITESGLGSAMNRARGKDGASQLSPRAEARLNVVLEALRRQNITQRVAKSATAGGGSNTTSDAIAAEAAGQVGDAIAGAVGVPSWVSRMGLGRLEDLASANRDRALAEALQNPDELLRILEKLERSGQPLSTEQSVLLNMLRGGASAGAN
jgi:hypothetical protein